MGGAPGVSGAANERPTRRCLWSAADPARKLGRVAEYTDDHLVTVPYLKNWCATDGKLRVRRVRDGSSAVATRRLVHYEKAWWSTNRALSAAAEIACSRLESHRQHVWQALQELIDRDSRDRGVVPVVRPHMSAHPQAA